MQVYILCIIAIQIEIISWLAGCSLVWSCFFAAMVCKPLQRYNTKVNGYNTKVCRLSQRDLWLLDHLRAVISWRRNHLLNSPQADQWRRSSPASWPISASQVNPNHKYRTPATLRRQKSVTARLAWNLHASELDDKPKCQHSREHPVRTDRFSHYRQN